MARTRSLSRAPIYLGMVGLVLFGTIQLNSSLRTIREREINTSLDVYNERLTNRQNLVVLGRLELLLGRLGARSAPKEELVLEARLQNVLNEEPLLEEKTSEGWLPAIILVNALRFGLGKEPLEAARDTPGLREVQNGYLLERLRRFGEAEEIYLAVLITDFDPDLRAPILLHLAFCQIMQGRLDDADTHLKTVIKDYVGSEEALTAKKMRDAIFRVEAERRRPLPSDPADRARAYLQRLQFAEAAGLAGEVLASRAAPERKARALAVLGEAAEAAGKPDEAADWYDRSLALDSESAGALETRRRLVFISRLQLKDPERAASHEVRLAREGDGDFVASLAQLSDTGPLQSEEETRGPVPPKWIVINSVPSSSGVVVDGQIIGYTPLPLNWPLPEGSMLELERNGETVVLEDPATDGEPLVFIWQPPSVPSPDEETDAGTKVAAAPAVAAAPPQDPNYAALDTYLESGWWIRPAWNEALRAWPTQDTAVKSTLRARAEQRQAEEASLRERLSGLYSVLETLPEVEREEWKSGLGWTGVGTGAILLTGMGVSIWAGNELYSEYQNRQDASAAELRLPILTLNVLSWTTGVLGSASLAGGGTLVWQDMQTMDVIRRRGAVKMEIVEVEERLKAGEPAPNFFIEGLARTP